MINANSDFKRILLVGDTHGDLQHWLSKILPAAKLGKVDIILQLGDFGYWPGVPQCRENNEYLNEQLKKMQLRVIFIDGNHEDHKALLKLAPNSDGMVPVSSNIFWAPRGLRWTWQKVSFLALGGAHSPDRKMRSLNSSRFGWFEEEILTEEQAKLAKKDGTVDVLLTHDAPISVRGELLKYTLFPGKIFPEADDVARRIWSVALAVKPKQLWHGHWHHFLDQQLNLSLPFTPYDKIEFVRNIGLACNGMDNSIALLELPSMQITLEKELLQKTNLTKSIG